MDNEFEARRKKRQSLVNEQIEEIRNKYANEMLEADEADSEGKAEAKKVMAPLKDFFKKRKGY